MTFTARYDGHCASEDCTHGTIERGDEVEYVDDELMHTGCASRQKRSTLPPRCDDCGLHHPGKCG